MSVQDKTKSSIEGCNDSIPESSTAPSNTKDTIDSILKSIYESVSDTSDTPPSSSTAPRIPRVPRTMRDKHDYEKYFVPKVASIGPYHFGEPQLQLVEKRKPVIAMKLCSKNKEALRSLFEKLGEEKMVEDLRSFHEENSTRKFSNLKFTKMMLLDSCFILYFIGFCYGKIPGDSSEFKSNEILFVHRDLYLLENQIPFKVLKEVMGTLWENDLLAENDLLDYLKPFIDVSSFVIRKTPKRKWLDNFKKKCSNGDDEDDKEPNHLLGALHGKHTRIVKAPTSTFYPFKFDGCNFRNVSELVDAGIHFKPIEDTLSITHIEFVKGWSRFSAVVNLPPITVTDSTKPMLLNMIAYETCCFSVDDSWVTSFVCLLDSLIDHPEDVTLLRKAWVLENYLSSDKEVADLFNELGTDLVESGTEYLEAKYKIQRHYDSRSNALFSQLKKEYFKNPWAIFVVLGALIAFFLTGVQTYYTVWSPKSTCDDLCMFLKINHHL